MGTHVKGEVMNAEYKLFKNMERASTLQVENQIIPFPICKYAGLL